MSHCLQSFLVRDLIITEIPLPETRRERVWCEGPLECDFTLADVDNSMGSELLNPINQMMPGQVSHRRL